MATPFKLAYAPRPWFGPRTVEDEDLCATCEDLAEEVAEHREYFSVDCPDCGAHHCNDYDN